MDQFFDRGKVASSGSVRGGIVLWKESFVNKLLVCNPALMSWIIFHLIWSLVNGWQSRQAGTLEEGRRPFRSRARGSDSLACLPPPHRSPRTTESGGREEAWRWSYSWWAKIYLKTPPHKRVQDLKKKQLTFADFTERILSVDKFCHLWNVHGALQMRFNVTSRQPARLYRGSKNLIYCSAFVWQPPCQEGERKSLLKALKEIQRWLIETVERLAMAPRPKDIDIGSFEFLFPLAWVRLFFYLCEEVSTFCDPWGTSLEELKVVSCQYEVPLLPPEQNLDLNCPKVTQ